jgi:methylmalonyl-CoA epimerase
MPTKIDHIGIAVADIEAALRVYRDALNLPLDSIERISSQKITTHHLQIGESHIELLHPTAPDSPVARFLEKKGPGIHHIALSAEDFDAARERAIAAGLEPVGEPSVGAGGKLIQFFHPKTTEGVLLEICSKEESSE